ncbi:MAG: hypothetical protein Q4C91_09230 [Eubacteriales bacterium]|nr:hypothetical protein [Eubacteriales bacterium]
MKIGKHIIGQHKIKTPKIAEVKIPPQPDIRVCKWFQKAAHGDRYALRRVYLLTNAAAYGYAYSVLRDGKAAETIVIQAYRTLSCGKMDFTQPTMPLFDFFQTLYVMAQGQADKQRNTYYVNALSFDRISDPTDRILLQTAFEVLPTLHLQILLLTCCCPVSMEELCLLFRMQPEEIRRTREAAVRRLLLYLDEE